MIEFLVKLCKTEVELGYVIVWTILFLFGWAASESLKKKIKDHVE